MRCSDLEKKLPELYKPNKLRSNKPYLGLLIIHSFFKISGMCDYSHKQILFFKKRHENLTVVQNTFTCINN